MSDLRKLAEAQLAEVDNSEPPTCERCHSEFSLFDDADACSFCARCTFAVADDLARGYLALLDRVERLEQFAHDMADDRCFYGDGCPPNAGTRHGTCIRCKARAAMEDDHG